MKEILKDAVIKGFNVIFENCETLYIPAEYVIKFSFKEMPVEYHFIKPFARLKSCQKNDNKNDLRNNPHFYIHQKYDNIFFLIDNHAFVTKDVIEKSFTFDFEEKKSDKTDNLNTNCFLERLLKYNDIVFIEPVFEDDKEKNFFLEGKKKKQINFFWDEQINCHENENQFSLRLKTKNNANEQDEKNEDLTLILVSSKHKKEKYSRFKIEKDFEETGTANGLLYTLSDVFENDEYFN